MKLSVRALQYLWLVGITLLVFSLSVLAWWNASPETSLTSLPMEEKETVLFAVQTLEWEYPSQKQKILKLREKFQDSSTDLLLDSAAHSAPLVRTSGQKWIFSDDFFSADPITQRNALLQLVLRETIPSEEVAAHH